MIPEEQIEQNLENVSKAEIKHEFKEDFEKLFEASVQNEKKEGKIVEGTVVAINNGYATVDVGLKSEGNIPLSEFTFPGVNSEIKVGDKVDVYVERFEGRGGLTVLSREKALRNEAWKKFEALYAQDAVIEGKIIHRVKGGFAVELGGIIAFLPGSQVDVRPIKDSSILLGTTQSFKILKMDNAQGNVVISRRVILEESRKEARSELLSSIKEGDVLEGVVKNITDYGAFIDLQSTDGLLHITDISWSKISHPSEILSVGQKLKVMVIKYNPESERISLGLKQFTKNPWEELKEKYKPGVVVKGKVMDITDYGAFVQLQPNIEGLVYYTEMHWLAKNVHPRKVVNKGDEVEVKVLDIDVNKHRVSLSMKQCTENAWEKFIAEHPVGSKIDVVVRNVTDFGVFVSPVEYENSDLAIIMLIPLVELGWEKNNEAELKKYNKGDKFEVVIASADVALERISASVKRLTEDKFATQVKELAQQQSVKATVLDIRNENIKVEIAPNVHAVIWKEELSENKDEQDTSRFKEGDSLDVKVLGFDETQRMPIVSIRALQEGDNYQHSLIEKGKKKAKDKAEISGDDVGGENSISSDDKKSKAKSSKSKGTDVGNDLNNSLSSLGEMIDDALNKKSKKNNVDESADDEDSELEEEKKSKAKTSGTKTKKKSEKEVEKENETEE